MMPSMGGAEFEVGDLATGDFGFLLEASGFGGGGGGPGGIGAVLTVAEAAGGEGELLGEDAIVGSDFGIFQSGEGVGRR